MRIGDYYVQTRQLRPNGTMEVVPRVERATPNREQAMREARGNAHRLKGDGRPFGVEVHEVVGLGETGAAGELGARVQFVTVFAMENACEKPGVRPEAAEAPAA